MSGDHRRPPAGSIGYLQLPTTDLDASIAFYANVFGWRGEEGTEASRRPA